MQEVNDVSKPGHCVCEVNLVNNMMFVSGMLVVSCQIAEQLAELLLT